MEFRDDLGYSANELIVHLVLFEELAAGPRAAVVRREGADQRRALAFDERELAGVIVEDREQLRAAEALDAGGRQRATRVLRRR